MKYRYEFDSLGKIKVPNDKYWGASTQRSNKYFDIGDFLVRPIVIKSIAMIKKAAAIINAKNRNIDKKLSKAIIKASNEVISGKLNDHFPLKVWQTGSGTQTNMNVRIISVKIRRDNRRESIQPSKGISAPSMAISLSLNDWLTADTTI